MNLEEAVEKYQNDYEDKKEIKNPFSELLKN